MGSAPCLTLTAAAQAEIRVSVALVGTPGVVGVVILPGLLARQAHRLAEVLPGRHVAVEALGEGQRGTVVHGPSSGDHGAHAHLDELHGQIGRQPMQLVPVRILAPFIQAPEVAAVQEHQLGHAAHLLHVAGGQHHALADDHAADQVLLLLRQRLTAGVARPLPTALRPVAVHTVASQVQDLVGVGVQRNHDLLGARLDQAQ